MARARRAATRGKEDSKNLIQPAIETAYWYVVEEDLRGETQPGELTGVQAGLTVISEEGKGAFEAALAGNEFTVDVGLVEESIDIRIID